MRGLTPSWKYIQKGVNKIVAETSAILFSEIFTYELKNPSAIYDATKNFIEDK